MSERQPMQVRLVAALLRVGGRLPLRVLHALGAGLGGLARVLGLREARVTARNLAMCFPELDEAARARLAREALAHTGRSLTELSWVWGGPAERALGLIVDVRGLEYFDNALARGQGLLVAAPHLGCWELLNLWLSTRGALSILYRVPQRAAFEPLLNGARTRLGAEAVRADAAGVRLLFRRLRAGGIVGILPDQRPKGGEGEDGLFFGQTAKTMTLLSRLAHKTGAPVVFGFAERLPKAAGFRLHFLPAEAAIASEDLVAAVGALNRGLEACVRLAPAQYQWTYKRFNFRKPGTGPDMIYGEDR